MESYEPTGTGEGPLANLEDWVNVPCPKCNGGAKRETHTMPNWAGSSWYQLRFIDPHNDKEVVCKKKEKEWMPVSVYTGGMEHAARHLIYARFWYKFLYDKKLVNYKEPFSVLKTVGIVQAEGGGKMSKRLGNVINPIEIAEKVGVDALRLYIGQIAPFSQTVAWDKKAIAGARRFLERVYAMKDNIVDEEPSIELKRIEHKTIHSVLNDIENYKFNTAISSLMIFSKHLDKPVPRECFETIVKLLAPFCPYITEDLLPGVHHTKMPEFDKKLLIDEEVTVIIQINGKKRGELVIPFGAKLEKVLEEIEKDEVLREKVKNKEIKAFIENKILSYI